MKGKINRASQAGGGKASTRGRAGDAGMFAQTSGFTTSKAPNLGVDLQEKGKQKTEIGLEDPLCWVQVNYL